MAPPKPKPRTELARAAAAASKWAFGTPGLSEKQQAAARRNYDYIQTRLLETGGGTTLAEERIGKQWERQRAARPITIPKPKGAKTYKPGDPEYSSDATLSAAEINKTVKRLSSKKTALAELERQGFQPPTTERQAQAQVKQIVRKIGTSGRASVAAALKNPLDVRGNADLVGPKAAREIAEAHRAATPPKPPESKWLGAAGRATDWVVPERVERLKDRAETETMGLTPDFLQPALRNLKSITADVAMAVPVIGETIYNDFTGKTRFAIPRMARDMLVGWGQGIEAATPLPADMKKTLGDVANGRWDELSADAKKDFQRMAEEWHQRPFTAILNLYPAVSGAARIAEFPSLARNIARANPNMSKAAVLRAARKESYVPGAGAARLVRGKPGKPGWKGGIPDRVLTGKVVHPETGEVLKTVPARARPPSRSAAGRWMQGQYDRWSGSDGPLSPGRVPGLGRFTELQRAAVAINKGRVLESDRVQVGLLQQMEPIESYIRQSGLTNKAKNALLGRIGENRARLSETFWGPQGPSKIDVAETLRAVATDLDDIAKNGGLEIPSNKLIAIDKEIRKVNSRLESLGPTVHLDQGDWAKATNLMREAGYSQPQIEMNLEVASALARAWAKREPGRNPDDWLGSEEGRNIADFRFGAPPPEALSQSLFQVLYPNDADIAEHPDNPYRQNRQAYDEQWAEFQRAKAAGEIPRNESFTFDPPHKTAYELTPDSAKSKIAIKAQRALHGTADLDGNMLDGLTPEEAAIYEKEVAPYLPREAQKLKKTGVGQEGEAHIGHVTLAEKDANAKGFFDSLTPEQQELFSRWYERVWDYVAYLYGDDKMREMGDAFFASQAAQSPAGGIANLFRTAQDIADGKPMPTGKDQWLQRNIYKLMSRTNLGEDPAGLAAKLMDFMDSGLGMRMRTIMQGAADKLGPGVVDRWTWRSDGYFPKPDSDEGAMLSRNIEGGVEPDNFLSTDKGGALAYEYSSRRLQALTNRWNQQGYKGRRDWTVDQVQAIDWFATKKRWVEDGLTPKSAEGGSPLDMALDNTREFVFDGSPAELIAAAEEVGAGVRIVSGKSVEGEPITFSVSKDGRTHAIVAGAGGSLDKLRMRLGEKGQTVTMRYPGSMGGTKTQRSHQFDFTPDRLEAARTAVHNAGLKEKDAPGLYQMGDDTYRLDFGHGKTGLAKAEAVADAMGIEKSAIVARFTESAGLPSDVLRDYRQAERSIKTTAKKIADDAAKKKKPPRKLGDAELAVVAKLDGLKERLGIAEGDTPTDDFILDRANRIVSESRGKPQTLYQRAAGGIAGAVQFLDTESGRQVMYLAEHANPSTFYHELVGHAAHEMKREFPTEFAKVEKRYGKELEDWETGPDGEHERFAREAERYLMTGKAPTPELQPVFTAMKRWMEMVYETIKALGKNKVNPETKALLDRYFGKEPLDFTPPQRLRRTGKNAFPATSDVAGIDRLVDDTSDLLMRGVDNLKRDPKARQQIAGSMKWLEQQVLPYVAQLDSTLSAKVHDLFDQFDEVKAGDSIFNPDERRLLQARGELLTKRHAELENIAGKLGAQPHHGVMAAARNVMEAADDPDLTLEDIRDLVKEIGHVSSEIRLRTQGDEERARWLSRAVEDLERALDPKRKVDKEKRDAAQNAMRDIAAEMKSIYLDVFGENLTPDARKNLSDTLDARDDILPTRLKELGLLDEGTDVGGHGSYVPHYSVFDQLFSRLRGPVRLPAAGRNRKILSMNQRADQMTFAKGPNKLVRYGTGELQVTPQALLSAFRQRMRFVETKMLREQLFAMAPEIPVDHAGNPRIPEGWFVINGTGKSVPERLKAFQRASPDERDEMLASGQDFDSLLATEGGTVKMLEEYRDSWLSKEEGGKPPPSWLADGTKLSDLRMLPEEVVSTMVGKVFESQPGGFFGSLGGLVGTAGRVATIFSHPMGYVQANVAANGILLMLTNPTRAPRAVMEFFKVAPSLRAKHPKLYETITGLTGDVQAGAGIPTFYVRSQTKMENVERAASSLTAAWAGKLGGVADQPFRVASWTGHARKYGFDDVEGWRLLATSDDPDLVKIREIVSQRAREDMLDFNKLSAAEQRMTRVLFIYPFIRAAVAQPVWLLREYPARVAAMASVANAQQSAYGEGDPLATKDKYDAILPAEERSMFDISDVPVAGGTLNMNPVNPLGPFTEKFNDLATVFNDPKQIGRVAAAQINPAFAAVGQGSFGYAGMDWEKVLGSTVPLASYVMAIMSAKKRGAEKYTDRSSWLDYLRRREVRFVPEDVDPEKIREAGKEAEEKLDTRPAWEKSKEEDLEVLDKILATGLKKTGREVDPVTKANIVRSINAYNSLDEYEDKMADDLGVDKEDLTEIQRVEATEAVLLEYYPRDGPGYIMDRDAVENLPDKARGGKASKQGYRQHLRDVIQYYRSAARKEGRDMGLEIE